MRLNKTLPLRTGAILDHYRISEPDLIIKSLKKRYLVLLLNYIAGDAGGIFDLEGCSLD